jgi:hypothetical protein
MCLNAPNITGELKYVVLKLFKKVRDTARKRFRDSYYITPGTVLRCDGATSRSAEDHDLSVTFICFPYLALGTPNDHHRQNSEYPTRSMLQVLYPYESSSIREAPPSFCKDAQHASECIMCVPQMWTVIIGSSRFKPALLTRSAIFGWATLLFEWVPRDSAKPVVLSDT